MRAVWYNMHERHLFRAEVMRALKASEQLLADAAIRQIKDRKYPQTLEGYTGEILLVGINYGRENRNKPHSCVIEKVEKTEN